MKKVILIFIMSLFLLGPTPDLQAQDDATYSMWESFYITPDNAKLKALDEAMAKHNKKYHKEGPNQAVVYDVVTGPNMGKMVWQMGPLHYSHLDNRPAAGGHDEDWRDNVMPNIKKLSNGEYWKQNDEVSNTEMLKDENPYTILHVRFFEVARGQGYQIDHLMSQIGATIKAMDGENPWGMYMNEFRQGYEIGRHLATVRFHKNWAEYDKEGTFKQTFLKLNGEKSWDPFVDGMDNSFSDSWDEIWVVNTKLSGN